MKVFYLFYADVYLLYEGHNVTSQNTVDQVLMLVRLELF